MSCVCFGCRPLFSSALQCCPLLSAGFCSSPLLCSISSVPPFQASLSTLPHQFYLCHNSCFCSSKFPIYPFSSSPVYGFTSSSMYTLLSSPKYQYHSRLLNSLSAFPPKLLETAWFRMRFHLSLSQFCIPLYFSLSRSCLRSISTSSIVFSV